VALRKPKDNGEAGVYNVVDDESATAAEWMPLYAEALGAKRPPRVPAFVARLIAGRALVEWSLRLRGASNEKIKEELGLRPQYDRWRRRFVEDAAVATPGGVAN
jgi:2-alkyl-3-oxoalkanoate reductase